MDGAGSHVPLLAAVVAIARPGPVLEVGVGDSSTPLLREMCKAMGRKLVGVDTSEEWARRYGALHVKDWAAFDEVFLSETWSVVFVDSSPWLHRLGVVTKVRAVLTEHIVIHDTDNQSGDLDDLLMLLGAFKHQHTDKTCTPWTTVVSETRSYP